MCYYYAGLEIACANNSADTWAKETVDDAGTNWESISAVMDGLGVLHLVYYDGTKGYFKYATNGSGAWQTSEIENTSGGLNEAVITLDSSGKVYVFYDSYIDGDNTDLKYVTNAGGSWENATVDDSGEVGGSLSAVFYDNKFFVSYYDSTNTNLKLATIDLAAPTTETSCTNAADDDGDDLIDCADDDCDGNAACETSDGTETSCTNTADDDGDLLIDCADDDCVDDLSCQAPATETLCSDTLDDDGDSLIDCADDDCADDDVCQIAGDDDDDGDGDAGDDDSDNDSDGSENQESSGGCQLVNRAAAPVATLPVVFWLLSMAGLATLRRARKS